MGQDKFIALTRKGEGAQIEYKTCTEEISESLYETVCSFLNHTGGEILVGVQDDGTIVGVNSDKAEKLKANILNCINNPELFLPCPYFTPRILMVEGKTVMLLDIPCGQYVYHPDYKIEINNGQQFVFSITYQDGNVTEAVKMSQRNVTENGKMSKGNAQGGNNMSKDETENVQGEMPKDNVPELTDEELALPLEPFERQFAKDKKNRRRQAIIGMIAKDSHVSMKLMSESLDVNIKTIWRDLTELKSCGVIERIGDDFTGEWKVVKKKE